jgi:hypothetical protein
MTPAGRRSLEAQVEAPVQGVKLILVTIVCVCVAGLLEGCASHAGWPGGRSQQDPQLGVHEQIARPGQDGTIFLRMPIWVARLQLKPGRYEFQQRVDRGEPRLHIIEVKRYAQFKRLPTISRRLVADVECRLEALEETAAETALGIRSQAGVARVEWVTLAGEDGRCLPGTGQR